MSRSEAIQCEARRISLPESTIQYIGRVNRSLALRLGSPSFADFIVFHAMVYVSRLHLSVHTPAHYRHAMVGCVAVSFKVLADEPPIPAGDLGQRRSFARQRCLNVQKMLAETLCVHPQDLMEHELWTMEQLQWKLRVTMHALGKFMHTASI
jgi:hypothetical protein